MTSLVQSLRDTAGYAAAYSSGRSWPLPRGIAEVYGWAIAKTTGLISLPLPFLSFLALPFYAGGSTTINLVFFYLTWSTLVLGHDQLTVEVIGTLIVRLSLFLVPALAFLAFDCVLPNISKTIKARGETQLPSKQLDRNTLLIVVLVASSNVLLAVMVQTGLEFLFTEILHLQSILVVSIAVPTPLTMLKDVVKGYAVRGITHYAIHRYLLHTYQSILRTWHLEWQHSISLPFSLVASYDHPIVFLLAGWFPTILPAYLFRFHVLTFQIFLALTSLEELFVYSGYAVLPSSIVLVGMARRTDAHFVVVKEQQKVGNYGHLGVLDFVCGTTCSVEVDVVDDLKSEVDKHHLQQQVDEAVKRAIFEMSDTRQKGESLDEKESNPTQSTGQDDGQREVESDSDERQGGVDTRGDDKSINPQSQQPAQRRSSRLRSGRMA
jgi:hypothetical protein